jgi:hypothetical protein
MNKIIKFITMWLLMILTALFMPVLTLCHMEVKISAKKK